MKRKVWPGLPRPSTRAFFREARRTPGYSFFDWLHGYVYGRWPYLYIGIATGEHPLARAFKPLRRLLARLFPAKATDGHNADRVTFADTYHGKVVPLEAATRLVTVQQEITLTDLEQVIPYAKARDIVLRNPDHIVVLECPCRASRPNPCQPLDVCLVIGEPFASFIAEHQPHRSRWITQEEAVEILRAEHERGHVHSRTPCWAASTPSATVAVAVAGRCRPGAMASPCWPPPATSARWMRTCASAAPSALSSANLGLFR